MIFKEQSKVNSFLSFGGDKSLLLIDGVMQKNLKPEVTSTAKNPQRKFITHLEKQLCIDEFGRVFDSDGHEIKPRKVKINNREEYCLPFKNSKNQRVYKRVIHLVAMAFMGENTPRKIIRHNTDYRLLMLDNIKKWSNSVLTQEAKEGKKNIMPLLYEEDLQAFLQVNNLKNSSDLKAFMQVTDEEYKEVNPKRFDVALNPDFKASLSPKIEYRGIILRLDRSGGLYRDDNDVITRIKGRYISQGSATAEFTCGDGKSRSITVANLLAKAFLGLPSDSRRKIKYIDGNPHNLHVNNLWWSDCNRPFDFSDILSNPLDEE